MTEKIPFDIIGFDLDGTLLDTSGDLTAAVNHALALAGRDPLPVAAVKTMIGGGAKLMVEKWLEATGGLPAEEFKPLYRALLGHYEANIAVCTHMFAGGEAVLDALDAMGVKYGVVTNKFESLAVKVLRELGLLERMAAVIGGDTLGPDRAKPKADPILELIARCGGGHAAFVGDSIYDIMAAKAAGIPSIACSFGFLLQPVEELEADAVIDHFDELIPVLRRLG